jgi:hypothetical protein
VLLAHLVQATNDADQRNACLRSRKSTSQSQKQPQGMVIDKSPKQPGTPAAQLLAPPPEASTLIPQTLVIPA